MRGQGGLSNCACPRAPFHGLMSHNKGCPGGENEAVCVCTFTVQEICSPLMDAILYYKFLITSSQLYVCVCVSWGLEREGKTE